MCGICGIYSTAQNRVDRDTVEKMTRSMSHRGPDGEGFYIGERVGLGHRRLSIIDIEGGAQPMADKEGSLQVVFNGEIYNFIELREKLKRLGHRFRTASDTEVIIHAYQEWGTNCVKHFNGIFSFALYDIRADRLFLARDHLGVKPLYYTQTDSGAFLFASEIKALLKHPDITSDVDRMALADLFTYRYVPSPITLFKGIMKIPPGHFMIIRDSNTQIKRFWDFAPTIVDGSSESSQINGYQDLLEDSVRIQLRSDVPVGLFLSSGVDSGVLLALMSKFTKEPIHTFTIGFEDGERTNELDGARELADLFGSIHHEWTIGPDDYLSYYKRYMRDLEEPVGNETAAAFYFVSLLAKDHVKVVLSGQGADEPWGGYHRHLGVKLSSLYSRLPNAVIDGPARLLLRFLPRNERIKRGVISLSEPDIGRRFQKIYSFFNEDMKSILFKPWLYTEVSSAMNRLNERLSTVLDDVKGKDPLAQILYLDTRTNLPDDLLMVGDKTSMANSIEMRVPFLDYRLIEYIESLPSRSKIRGMTGKYLHKKSLSKWLPASIINRKKKGFSNPVNEWLRTHMSSFIEEVLLSADSATSMYFDKDYMRHIYDLHKSHREDHMRHIYLLLSFEMWHREFIGTGL